MLYNNWCFKSLKILEVGLLKPPKNSFYLVSVHLIIFHLYHEPCAKMRDLTYTLRILLFSFFCENFCIIRSVHGFLLLISDHLDWGCPIRITKNVEGKSDSDHSQFFFYGLHLVYVILLLKSQKSVTSPPPMTHQFTMSVETWSFLCLFFFFGIVV